jgi:transposase, IS6 family
MVHSVLMMHCPSCQRPATKRDGYDEQGRQRYSGCLCHRDCTAPSASAFSGYRWPPDVSLTAVRWYASSPLSAAQVMHLLAERHLDISARTVLTWVQTFGPQLAKALQPHRRRLGRRWYVDEVFCFRGKQKRSLYRAVDHHGQVIDILLRDTRDHASAAAFFRRALSRPGASPHTVVSDHHQPSVKAVATALPLACHLRTGLHRARGETTKPIERSHIATRDRLRCTRGLKTVASGRRFLECFESLQSLRRGDGKLRGLVPGYQPTKVSPHETTRAVMVAMNILGARLKREPR